MVRIRLTFWYLVVAMLSESAYSNFSKEVCEVVRFTMNMKESTTVPKLILLQLTPRVHQKIKLSVRGGCPQASRDYNWFSSDRTIVSVSPLGIIRAKRPGLVTVKAVSTCDPQNFDLIVVKVFASQDMCYDMDDMEANPDYIISKPKTLFERTLPKLVFPLGILIGKLVVVFCPAKRNNEPCSSTSHSKRDRHRTKRLRRTLTTIAVRRKIYRRRWIFRRYISHL